jgi:hypothetical protein
MRATASGACQPAKIGPPTQAIATNGATAAGAGTAIAALQTATLIRTATNSSSRTRHAWRCVRKDGHATGRGT